MTLGQGHRRPVCEFLEARALQGAFFVRGLWEGIPNDRLPKGCRCDGAECAMRAERGSSKRSM